MDKNIITKVAEKVAEKLGLLKQAEEVPTGTTESEIGSVIVSEIVPAKRKFSYSAIGAPVMAVLEDGTEEVIEDGEFKVEKAGEEEGEVIEYNMTVLGGKLETFVRIEETPAEPEDLELKEETKVEVEPEVKKEVVEEVKTELELKEETPEETKTEVTEEPKEEVLELSETQQVAFDDTLKMASQTITKVLSNIKDGITKAGSYYISLSVNDDLTVDYANMDSYAYEDLMLSLNEDNMKKIDKLETTYNENLKLQKEKYEAIVESHKKGAVRQTDAPEKPVIALSRADVLKMQIEENRKNKNNEN